MVNCYAEALCSPLLAAAYEGTVSENYASVSSSGSAPACRFSLSRLRRGEGGIRTLGSLLGYGALAKRCFQPLSHLTKIVATALWAVSGRATNASEEYRD